jgi:isopentenyldiphosphate isomerase
MQTTDNQKELFDRVNINDEVIGVVTRGQAHSDKNIIHRSVGILVFNDQGELYCQKRSVTKDLSPGVWGISTAGHVTSGFGYLETAVRELQEEVGIVVNPNALKLLLYNIVALNEETEVSQLFRINHNGPFVLDKKESSEGRFFDLQELENLIYQDKIKMTIHSLINLQLSCGIIPKEKDLQKFVIKTFN